MLISIILVFYFVGYVVTLLGGAYIAATCEEAELNVKTILKVAAEALLWPLVLYWFIQGYFEGREEAKRYLNGQE